MTSPKTGKEESVKIPKWLLIVMFSILSAAGTWAHSVSIKLNVMAVHLENAMELKDDLKAHAINHVGKLELAELRRRIEVVEERN